MPLGPGHVGQRVVVRYRLPDPAPGGPSMTDVLGELEAYDAVALVVRTEAGEQVRVPAASLVAGKPIPPRAATLLRVRADTLERICSDGWPARTVEALGEWQLREAAGFTGRANSVLPVGDPGCSLPEALTAVREFYARHDLPALAQAVIGAPVEEQLLAAGWGVARHREGALVQVASVAQARRASRSRGDGVELLPAPDDAWMSLYGRTAGVPADVVAGVLAGPATVALAAVGAGPGAGPGARPVAIGRGVVTGDWLGLSAVEVVPERRRQGLARRVVDALLAWGAEQGARSAYLQTMPGNEGALALYAPYGFVTHHRYRYLSPGSDLAGRGHAR